MAFACQAVVAVTFAYSAAAKAGGRAAFTDFRGWLSSAAAVPAHAAAPVAAGLVALEAATAVAVLVPALALAGFVSAVLLLVAFSAGVRSMMRRRVGVPCRCFGKGRRPPGVLHLLRNGALLAVAAAGGVLTAADATPPPVEGATLLAAVAGGTVALLLINLEEIVALYRS
ncbi:MauE/DoxX family redox-associated membrane protein [Spirillospora sp. NPDC048911]|uniref:MauE/DoxX family redox-associated membrane protein n=1 Tax=Spirillospora sp. NPDC048911 TaxID=3364527 RepID=UPI0037221A78